MSEETSHDVILEKISNIQLSVNEIKAKLEKDYATQQQLKALEERVNLLQRIVFWFVALIVVAVVTWWMTLLFTK